MPTEPIWLTEADVVRVMDLAQAIEALEEGLRLQHAGDAFSMSKTHLAWAGGDTLHAIGAVMPGAGLFATKTWGHTHGGATPLLLLWNAADGRLEAIVEAFALGQMRTGATSGVATKYLAAPDADAMAVIGTGKQAAAQVAAVAAVRKLVRVRVFGRSREGRQTFAAKLAGHGFAVDQADSVEAAVADASIVTTVTRSREPLLEPSMLMPGAHINAIGAITPEREELAAGVMSRARLVAADDPEAAGRLSREVMRLEGDRGPILPLCDVVARPPDHEPVGWTVFKAMGVGLGDLSLGRRILQSARALGLGRPIPHPERASPRLFAD